MFKAIRLRLCPTKSQAQLLAKNCGCARFVYNYFLNRRIEEYETNGIALGYAATCRLLTQLKRNPDNEWLNEVDSQTCNACGAVDRKSRKNQATFSCTSCGYHINADTNAALNIRDLGLAA